MRARTSPHLSTLLADDIETVCAHAEILVIGNRDEAAKRALDLVEGKKPGRRSGAVSNQRAGVMASTTASAGSPLESGLGACGLRPRGRRAGSGAALGGLFASRAGALSSCFVGLIGTWRYGWGVLHFARSIVYRRVAFPRLRAEAAGDLCRVEAAAGVPAGDQLPHRCAAPRRGSTALRSKRRSGHPARPSIVASIVEMADQRLIKALFDRMVHEGEPVELVFVRIAGTGKRDALAYGFRAIARRNPDPHDLVAVIDGDSIVPPDLIASCAPFFLLDERVGALTTDEQLRGRRPARSSANGGRSASPSATS